MPTETETTRNPITFVGTGSRWQKAGRLREDIAISAPLGPAGFAIAIIHRDVATLRWHCQAEVDGVLLKLLGST